VRTLPVLTTDGLHPYIEVQRSEVTAGLHRLLDLPPDPAALGSVPMQWRMELPEGESSEHVVVEVGQPVSVTVVLSGLLVKRGPLGAVDPVRLGARFHAAASANAQALLKRIKASLTRPPAELSATVSGLAVALRTHLGLRPLRDEEFRKISSSPAGSYGTLRLGYRCNQDCHFCWQDRTAPSPPDEQFAAWLDQMGQAGVKSLNITGGEPTTYAVLPDLIGRATSEYGMAVTIQSNAISLAQPKYMERLVRAGLVGVMTSYHSADSATSDELTRAPGTHVKTREGIQNALGAGLMVSISCVVERQNVEHLEDHARDIVATFVTPFPANPPHRVTYTHPTGYFEDGLWGRTQVSFDIVRPNVVGAARIIHAAGVPVQVTGTSGFPRCMLNGAPELLAQEPLQRELFDAQQLKHLRYASVCQTCTEKPACFGLRPEYLDQFGERGLLPFA
jgi:pyruvate-formate lyase-activating enzyme